MFTLNLNLLSAMIPLAGIYAKASPTAISANLTARASGPFPIQNGEITAYYDGLFHKNGNRCGVQYASPKWPVSDQAMWTACQKLADETVAPWLWGLQTDRIVAIDLGLINAEGGVEKWCGKEVRITKPNGEVFEFSEGPLFVWDGCGSCASGGVDLSVPAFLDLAGLPDQSCGRESGFNIEVLDNNVWEPALDRSWTPPNGSGKFWDKWTKEVGNSWTKAMEVIYTGASLVLPNGEKVEAASNEVVQPASVSPVVPATTSAVGQQVAPSAVVVDTAQSSSSGSGTAETNQACAAQGLWSCSADSQWLMVCDTSATGPRWKPNTLCGLKCSVSTDGKKLLAC